MSRKLRALDSDFWQILCSYTVNDCPLPLDVLHVCDQKEWPEESDGSFQGDGDGRMLSCLHGVPMPRRIHCMVLMT